MQKERILENNVVNIAGTIVKECEFSHEVYGEGFYIFYISVDRLSDNNDILPVTISERLIDINTLKEGLIVDVTGQLRSYNNYSEKRNRLILTIFARELEILDEYSQKNPNQICLTGFVCKNPVYRKTPFGREISDILLAVNRAYNKSDYIPCIAWGRNARFTNNLKIGDNIKLWGRIQSRKYQKKTGENVEERTAYEVSISKIEVIENAKSEENIED